MGLPGFRKVLEIFSTAARSWVVAVVTHDMLTSPCCGLLFSDLRLFPQPL